MKVTALKQMCRRATVPGMLIILLAAYLGHVSVLLFASRTAVGFNGFYYLLQVHSLHDGGKLYFPSATPLAFYVLSSFSNVTGDAIVGVKIGTIFLAAVFGTGVYLLIWELTRSHWWPALAVALLSFSTILAYIVTEYQKCLLSLGLLTWSAFFAIRGTRNYRWHNVALTVALLVGALSSHRSMWVIVPCLGLSAALIGFVRGDVSRATKLWQWAACIAVLMVLPAILTVQSAFPLPQSFSAELTASPQWPIASFAITEKVLLLLASVGTMIRFFSASEVKSPVINQYFLPILATCSFLISFNPFLNRGFGSLGGAERLSDIVSVWATPILASAFLSEHSRRLGNLVTCALVGCVLTTNILSGAGVVPEGDRSQYLASREELVRVLESHRREVSHCPLVLARHGEQFVVTDITGVPAQRERPSDSRVVCWLVRFGMANPMLKTTLGRQQDGSSVALVEDDDLKRLLATMPSYDRDIFLNENPHVALRM